MKNVSKLITVVIPCKNEQDYIYKTLESISKQSGCVGIRIIVADAGSTDRTLEEIERARIILGIEVDIVQGGPVAIARNRGAFLTKTPYVVFIDADVVLLDEGTISKTVSLLESGSARLVTCRTVNTSNDIRAKAAYSTFNVFRRFFMKEPFAQGTYIATSIMDFDAFGGFDESVNQSEDFLLTRKYPMQQFVVLNDRVTQDDRRFKKMGYIGFIKLVITNYMQRNNHEHFTRDVGYW
jgi:glycosyltransferase involved in cell wall biosynthesis